MSIKQTKANEYKEYEFREVPSGQEHKSQLYFYKENGKELAMQFTYLTKRQMNRFVREQEKSNCYTPNIEGYFQAKKSRDSIITENGKEKHSVDASINIEGQHFDVRYKPKVFHRVKGYVFTKEKNVVLAIEKFTILPIILLLLLLLGMLLCFNYCNSKVDDNNPWRPVIQDFSNQWQDEDTTKSQNSIDVIGFTAISVDSKTGNAKVSLINPEGNPCYFKFYIYTESGVPLYESDLVPPNKEITKITLNTKLEEGSHKGYVFIETFELETGNEMNSAKFDIDIISR